MDENPKCHSRNRPDAKVTVGTSIECIGGCNSGLKGRALKITPCYCRFKAKSLAFRTKLVMASKAHAKAINDVFSKRSQNETGQQNEAVWLAQSAQ